jgi:hypothetical protein
VPGASQRESRHSTPTTSESAVHRLEAKELTHDIGELRENPGLAREWTRVLEPVIAGTPILDGALKKKRSSLLDDRVPFITPDDLMGFVRLFESDYAASGALQEWIDNRVRRRRDGVRTYMHPPPSGQFDGFKHQDCLSRLGEDLVNLQDVKGFDSCIRELRRDSVETGFAKMMAAGILRRQGIPSSLVNRFLSKESVRAGTR